MTCRGRWAGSLAAWAVAFAVVQLSLTSPVDAQTRRRPPRRSSPARPTPHAGSWEVSGGVLWQGGFDLGTADAELTQNPANGTGPYTQFSSASKLGSGVGVQARITGYLSKNFALEGGLRLTRPVLTVRLSDDVEAAPDQAAKETLTQYVIDGSAVWHFATFHRGRGVPFIAGGAGYIRDLHQGSGLMETGTEYHGLAGLKLWFSNRPRRLGLRVDAGFSVRDGGFDFREGRRTVPIASASLTYLF